MSISGHVLVCLLHICQGGGNHCISFVQHHSSTPSFKISHDKQEADAFKVTFLNYKHNYNQPPFSFVISSQTTCCPVQNLLLYLQARGHKPGPVFQMPNDSLVPWSIFTEKLSTALKFCGLELSRYKGHSSRIGAATHAVDKGMSDGQIRAMGRPKSSAFFEIHSLTIGVKLALATCRGCCLGIFPLAIGLISRGSRLVAKGTIFLFWWLGLVFMQQSLICYSLLYLVHPDLNLECWSGFA